MLGGCVVSNKLSNVLCFGFFFSVLFCLLVCLSFKVCSNELNAYFLIFKKIFNAISLLKNKDKISEGKPPSYKQLHGPYILVLLLHPLQDNSISPSHVPVLVDST